jgi:hypothetical protein
MTKTLQQKQTEAKGFALYVGISESEAEAAGTTLSEIAIALREKLSELIPGRNLCGARDWTEGSSW